MRKFVFFAFKDEPMCFVHVLLNAIDLHEKGYETKIIFEGPGVKLPAKMTDNKMFVKAKEMGLMAGICEACSKALEVYEENSKLDIPFVGDLNGHPSMESFIKDGYEIIVM